MTDRYLVRGFDSEGWPVSTDVYATYLEAVNQTMNLESAGFVWEMYEFNHLKGEYEVIMEG